MRSNNCTFNELLIILNECKIASNKMLNKLMKHFKSEFDVWWISAGSINKYFVIACQNWWIVFLLHQWHDLGVWLEYQMCSCAPPHLAGTERVFAWRIFCIIRHVSFTRKLKCNIWLLLPAISVSLHLTLIFGSGYFGQTKNVAGHLSSLWSAYFLTGTKKKSGKFG